MDPLETLEFRWVCALHPRPPSPADSLILSLSPHHPHHHRQGKVCGANNFQFPKASPPILLHPHDPPTVSPLPLQGIDGIPGEKGDPGDVGGLVSRETGCVPRRGFGAGEWVNREARGVGRWGTQGPVDGCFAPLRGLTMSAAAWGRRWEVARSAVARGRLS